MPKTTIGVIGKGTLSSRMIRATLADQLDALAEPEDLRLILPATKDLFTEEVEIVADWAIANGAQIELVGDDSKAPKALGEYAEVAVKNHTVRKVPTGLVKILAKTEGAKLFVFWDEDDEEGYTAFEDAFDAEIPSYDICNGLEELTFDDDADEPVEEPEAAEEPEEEAPRHDIDPQTELRRKTAKELKEICKEKGITVSRSGKGRIAKDAYIEALVNFEETGATEFHQEEDRVKVDETLDSSPEPATNPQAVDEAVDEDEVPEIEDDGAIPEADEDEPIEIPSDEEDTDVEPGEGEATALPEETVAEASTPTNVVNTVYWSKAQAGHIGTCAGCGGPIFALYGSGEETWPEVRWNHAPACGLASS